MMQKEGSATNQRDRFDAAWQAMLDGEEQGAYAGAVGLIAQQGQIKLHRATGWAVKEPYRVPMTPETIFDLASLTKVTATLPSVLQQIDVGKIGLDQPVGEIIPGFGCEGWKAQVTIRRLLSHSAGFPAWQAVYLDGTGPEAYLTAISNVKPAYVPGSQVIYSDFSFILLAEVVRQITGDDISTYSAREVFAPLGMTDTMFTPAASLHERIAATEIGNPYEYNTCGERAAEFPGWRTELIRGEVHDGNAFYGLGGVAGHAGLFSTAVDLFRYGQCWLNGGELDGERVISAELVREATREQAPGRGLGWRLPSPDAEETPLDPGRALGPRSYGHTGFTGTMLWMEPDQELVVVLLTNRVHPTVVEQIGAVRHAFNSAIAEAVAGRASA
jgi:CubicO group peptidase (beta-lactamase class C family)